VHKYTHNAHNIQALTAVSAMQQPYITWKSGKNGRIGIPKKNKNSKSIAKVQ
jgi:hypothetical protein